MAHEIEQRDPRSLKNHLVNIEIYGTHPVDEFVASVRAHGVLVPLTITANGTVISGHSRRQAAIIAGLETVPCIVSPLTDPDEIERALIESNRQREKTNEQRAREAARLLTIEERLALKRREQNLKRGGTVPEVVTVPLRENAEENVDFGKTRDKIGKVVGMGGRTVARAVEVVAKIDEAKALGDEATASKLTRTLNEKGVAPALREARKDHKRHSDVTGEDTGFAHGGKNTGRQIDESLALGKEFDQINREVRASIRRMKELGQKPGGAFLDPNKLQEIEDKLGNGLSAFLGAKPYQRCPYCGGPGCKGCRMSGVVTRMIFDNAPEARRKAVA